MSHPPAASVFDADRRACVAHARVSVVIPHLDDLTNLAAAVAAVRKQTLDPSRYEIIIADNGSRCGLDAVRRAAPGAVVVPVPERGAGPARNGGARVARGDVLAFTDSDCRPHVDWLERGLQALGASDVVGGGIDVGVEDRTAMTPSEAFEALFAFDNRDYVERLGFSVTANLMVRKSTFEQVGPFRSEVSEDVEWCRRATARGARLAYAHEARVIHPARRTWSVLERKWRRTNREAFALWLADGGSRSGWALRAVAVLASPTLHWLRVARSRALPDMRSRCAALGVLLRLRIARSGWMLRQVLSNSPAHTGAIAKSRATQEAV
jgi:glycosyltransferase involved in cell wall biosynthesis